MHIQVISPDRQIFNGEITQAILPGANTLNTTTEGTKIYEVDGDVIEVVKNQVRILVETIV